MRSRHSKKVKNKKALERTKQRIFKTACKIASNADLKMRAKAQIDGHDDEIEGIITIISHPNGRTDYYHVNMTIDEGLLHVSKMHNALIIESTRILMNEEEEDDG